MDSHPRNATALAKTAAGNGWAVKLTEGEGHVERGRGETKHLEPVRSVAVRLSNADGVRAFGVWVDEDDGKGGRKWGYDNGAAIRPAPLSTSPRGGHIFALLGYRELAAVVGRQ